MHEWNSVLVRGGCWCGSAAGAPTVTVVPNGSVQVNGVSLAPSAAHAQHPSATHQHSSQQQQATAHARSPAQQHAQSPSAPVAVAVSDGVGEF